MADTPSEGEDGPPAIRPPLDVPPLAAGWVVAAGVAVAMLFVLTDHMLRATTTFGGTLALAALLRLTLSEDRIGGLAVRGRWVDAITLMVLSGAVLASGFAVDLAAR